MKSGTKKDVAYFLQREDKKKKKKKKKLKFEQKLTKTKKQSS